MRFKNPLRYSIAFTDQWTNQSFSTKAVTVLSNKRGVTFLVPPEVMRGVGGESESVLYDVHLIIDGKKRSENRRALTLIASSDTDGSSSMSEGTFDQVNDGPT